MTVVMRKVEFDAGHRLVNHESKCAHLHGHRYVAEIYCEASELDSVGRVVDFSCIKKEVGGWLDDNWDHATIVNSADSPLVDYLKANNLRHYCMDTNPTAENMAQFLLELSGILLQPYSVACVKVRLWETPNCFAEVNK